MRKISMNAAKAFEAGKNFKGSNTEVESYNGVSACYLHGNKIAEKEGSNFRFSMCGWGSVTTRERLNSLLPAGNSISQSNYSQIFRKWDASGKVFEAEIDPDLMYLVTETGLATILKK